MRDVRLLGHTDDVDNHWLTLTDSKFVDLICNL